MEVFTKLREELNELGYTQTLKIECVPLVDKLLADLKVTTDNLQKYMKISQQAVEELNNLKLGAEPYKCDNAKLIKECNELHLAFIQFKEQHEKVQKELKLKNSLLENQLRETNKEKENLIKTNKQLETRLKSDKKKLKTPEEKKQFVLNSAMAHAEEKIAQLSKELRRLKEEQLRCFESNDFYKTQLKNREEEIVRLNKLLSGGRPAKSIADECCYKNIDNKIGELQDEINALKAENNSLNVQLKEAVAKQHEAMKRALHLAERNKLLENEMRDIDRIALEVESECNDRVRNNADRITRLQDRLNESIITIQNLERENCRLKNERSELMADLTAIKTEKRKLQNLLESEVEDKKRLTDRINNFSIIEQDLNLEIDRLVRLTSEQKTKIAELEYNVISGKVHQTSVVSNIDESRDCLTKIKPQTKKTKNVSSLAKSPVKSKKVGSKSQEPKKTSKKTMTSNQVQSQTQTGEERPSTKCCCETGHCIKSMKELLEKEMEHRQFQLQREHDELLKTISEKNALISDLQTEIRRLNQDKYALKSRENIDHLKADEMCNNITCKRKNRELEVLREELKYLEKENANLKDKIQSLNESRSFDQDKIQRAFQEMEEHIRKLEDERRDLVVEQCSSRTNVSQLHEEVTLLREQLRMVQNEANGLRATNNQLKTLNEQNTKALTDAQNQLLRCQTELHEIQNRMQYSQRESSSYETEIARLKGDVEVLRSQLSKIDREKDELLNVVDEKTEKIDQLESQLKEKKSAVNTLEQELKDLKRKLSKTSDEMSGHEMQLRASKQEIAVLEQDIENERKIKESALQENRRLQSDLASVTCDCREARKELEITKRQVDDLKTQLQQYVAEVRRAEDLISQKELERNEILDQFKCLSEEANVLENNNHTLENEATQSKVQLSVALDHANDLERKIANQESIIRSYEKQITELTNQIACLEMQVRENGTQQNDVVEELRHMKELCLKLDREKDELRRQFNSRDEQRGLVSRDVEKLTRENQELKKALDRDQNSLDGLEKLLNEARQEIIEQRVLNEELQNELKELRKKIQELQSKHAATSEQLDLYQERALEYSQEVKRLRREIANERFARSREDDKRYPSLSLTQIKSGNATEDTLKNVQTASKMSSSSVDRFRNCEKMCQKTRCVLYKNQDDDKKVPEIVIKKSSQFLRSSSNVNPQFSENINLLLRRDAITHPSKLQQKFLTIPILRPVRSNASSRPSIGTSRDCMVRRSKLLDTSCFRPTTSASAGKPEDGIITFTDDWKDVSETPNSDFTNRPNIDQLIENKVTAEKSGELYISNKMEEPSQMISSLEEDISENYAPKEKSQNYLFESNEISNRSDIKINNEINVKPLDKIEEEFEMILGNEKLSSKNIPGKEKSQRNKVNNRIAAKSKEGNVEGISNVEKEPEIIPGIQNYISKSNESNKETAAKINKIEALDTNVNENIKEKKCCKFCLTLNLSTYSSSTSSGSKASIDSKELLQVCSKETVKRIKDSENPWRIEVRELDTTKNAFIRIKKR